jgi:hypothetical protein
MALVSNYSSSDEDMSDNENEDSKAQPKLTNGTSDNHKEEEEKEEEDAKANGGDLISDDEDDFMGGGGIFDDATEDIPGLSTAGSNSFFSSLPSMSSESSATKIGFVDENEDLSTIPQANTSEQADAEAAKMRPKGKKKQKGKVRIVLPSLDAFDDVAEDEEGATARKKMRLQRSAAGSALLTMLPNPKNAVPSKEPYRMLVPDAVANRRHRTAPSRSMPSTSKRPITHDSDSDDDDDDQPTAFFTLEREEVVPIMPELPAFAATDNPGPSRVNANPGADRREPAAAVGPSRPVPTDFAYGYADASDLMANDEALERLAGKHALRNKIEEDFSKVEVVDVNEDQLTADPREWLTKALTEDAADKPGPKCTVKGQTKRKHQITYLAAIAKENEHKLKQQWANAAANKRAAGAKYGF